MQQKSATGGLLDFSFSEFVTMRIVQVLYVLAILFGVLIACGIFLGGWARGGVMGGVGGLILGIIVLVLYVIFARVWLEMIVVIFRIAENSTEIVALLRDQRPQPISRPQE